MLRMRIVWFAVTSPGVISVPGGHGLAEPVHGPLWSHNGSEHFEECRIAVLKPLASSHPSALRRSSWAFLGNPYVFSILVNSCLTNHSKWDGRWAIPPDGEGNYYVGAVRPRPRPACGEADDTRCFTAHRRVHWGPVILHTGQFLYRGGCTDPPD